MGNNGQLISGATSMPVAVKETDEGRGAHVLAELRATSSSFRLAGARVELGV